MASSKLSKKSLTQNDPNFAKTDAILLQQAVEKLALFGQQVGVSPEQMISLLDSGCSIRDLLAFLASKNSGVA
jgi:hypothetical protein